MATKAIEFYLDDFSKGIPYVWAHEIVYITIYRQTEATWRTARKFPTNMVGQISNRRLVRKVLDEKNETGRLGARPQACELSLIIQFFVKLEYLIRKFFKSSNHLGGGDFIKILISLL